MCGFLLVCHMILIRFWVKKEEKELRDLISNSNFTIFLTVIFLIYPSVSGALLFALCPGSSRDGGGVCARRTTDAGLLSMRVQRRY